MGRTHPDAFLHAARLHHRIVTFTRADHAFFDDTGARFNAAAADEAWHRVLELFAEGYGHGPAGAAERDAHP